MVIILTPTIQRHEIGGTFLGSNTCGGLRSALRNIYIVFWVIVFYTLYELILELLACTALKKNPFQVS